MSEKLLQYILDKEHHKFRGDLNINLAREYKSMQLSPIERMTDRFERLSKAEIPHFLPDEKIVFLRTVKDIPDIFTEDEWANIKSKHYIHEMGYVSNLSPNYEDAIQSGLLEKRKYADGYGKRVIDSVIMLSDRYREEAKKQGKDDVIMVLNRIPRFGATNFREALQFLRLLNYTLWLEGNYHNTLGRFDQYMYPYFENDIKKGIHTEDTALELLEDFFISLNKDTDLYAGVQQGDNGQSMVLGGVDSNGNDAFNRLSRLCIIASRNLKLIDPKINLRVNKNTPLSVYELGTELTKAGLGFPQYSNDDVVIDGLVNMGYELEDARDYAVAACWEFIIPKCGGDVANIGALSFPGVVDIALRKHLKNAKTFDEFMAAVGDVIQSECERITGEIKNLWFVPSPFMTVLMDGIKYRNFGIHGTGLANGSDSLAAIKKHIFEDKTFSAHTLIEAVESDFSKHEELLPILRFNSPKMGNDDDYVDGISIDLLNMFYVSLDGRINCKGGNYRAGTGSAMYYLWHANEIGASPDGRRKGEAFGANISPSLFAKVKGPISVIRSFTKQPYPRAINGGPLTMEFHSSLFSDNGSIEKIAGLVKYFIDSGGHQLQLNAIDVEKLREAQISPEKYRQLVVRVWGWSAYFTELDLEYQNHVILRQEYTI